MFRRLLAPLQPAVCWIQRLLSAMEQSVEQVPIMLTERQRLSGFPRGGATIA